MKRPKKPRIAKGKTDLFSSIKERLDQGLYREEKAGDLSWKNSSMPHVHRDIWM